MEPQQKIEGRGRGRPKTLIGETTTVRVTKSISHQLTALHQGSVDAGVRYLFNQLRAERATVKQLRHWERVAKHLLPPGKILCIICKGTGTITPWHPGDSTVCSTCGGVGWR